MKDYSAMSDFDIQQAVLQETWGKHPVRLLGKMMLDIMLSDYDPCNNPADAWPIILNNGINIFTDMIPHGLLGQARVSVISGSRIGAECLIAKHINPLRAAMEVYLMKKDAEKSHG
ncbi:phage protein NinX family protein [Rahnella inusitata]|uniref:phage protein NinX family protein n=1 Tax=Rahnella inusitata TaxID=58169 RepID=UPI0039BE5A21